MSVSFRGFNENSATFMTTKDMEKGTPVKMSASDTVAPCSNGDAFCGVVNISSGSYASVQLSGAVTAKYTGTAPSAGYTKLVSGATGVKTGENGREYLVVSVDTVNSTVTFLL